MVLVVAGTTSSWAQSYEDIRLEREARFAVLMQIDNYKLASRLNNDKRRVRFQKLFAEDGAQHILDLPMFNNVGQEASLSPSQYADLYDDCFNIDNRRVDVKLNLLSYRRTSEYIEIRAFVTKSFKGSTSANQWKFEDPTFDRELEMVWQCQNHNEALSFWKSEEGAKNSTLEFRLKQVNWGEAQKTEYITLVNENELRAESCGDLLVIPGQSTGLAIYVSESPVLVIRDSTGTLADTKIEARECQATDSPNEVLRARALKSTAQRKPWSWSISAGTSLNTLGRLDSDYSESHTVSSLFGTSFAARVGFAIEQSHDMIFDVCLGTKVSTHRHSLMADQVYFEEPQIDPDNFAYLRQSYGSQWTESLSEKVGGVTLELRYLKQIERWSANDVITYLGLSVGINHSIVSTISFDNSASVIRQGYYEGLYGITIDENGIYDFGSYSASGAEANTSWSSASAVPIHAICARKRDPLTPWMTWVEVGPSLHFRTGTPSEEGPFISNSQLHSAFHEANRYTFVNLDVQVGIRKRIGWNTIEPCPPQP